MSYENTLLSTLQLVKLMSVGESRAKVKLKGSDFTLVVQLDNPQSHLTSSRANKLILTVKSKFGIF